VVFAFGLALGVMFMVPRWWRSRKAARLKDQPAAASAPAAEAPTAASATGQSPHGI
jgi:hypothetical protein